MIRLQFDKGTLLIYEPSPALLEAEPAILWDERIQGYRAPAYLYRQVVMTLRAQGQLYQDHARQFQPQRFELRESLQPRDYQMAASQAWQSQGKRGVIALPTGAGKTILAVMLIAQTERPTLIHVPTIDLMHQWHSVLTRYFGGEIGLLGGGYHEIQALTIATYDSALLQVIHRGHQFGLIIFDECHHLPGEQYQYLALSSIAPFRLGLTATPERSDGREALLYQLCGPLCYQAHIHELEGRTLAPYEVVTLEVEMLPEEREEYEQQRECYIHFLKGSQVDLRQANGWQQFLWKASRTAEGRQAFKAFLRQKKLSQASASKEAMIWELLQKHREDRILIFTQDNEMAYRIGQRFFLPVLTHHTKLKEREAFLNAFRQGKYRVLVTSKVLNEGVDVPEANVGIIVSGSGSIREHVQRLGRLLRGLPGKQAWLYELVSKSTGEYFINQRRRQHLAYQR